MITFYELLDGAAEILKLHPSLHEKHVTEQLVRTYGLSYSKARSVACRAAYLASLESSNWLRRRLPNRHFQDDTNGMIDNGVRVLEDRFCG